MIVALHLAAALAGQTPPPPPAPPEIRRDVRIITAGADAPARDRDGDGFISREEFAGPTEDAFALLDKDRDGRISTEELTAGRSAARVILGGAGGSAPMAWAHRGPGGPGDHNVMMFHADPEGGAPGERNVMVFPSGGPDAGPGRRRIEVRRVGGPGGEDGMDKDKDGKVTEAEFLAPLREAFRRMDANNSGALEEGERGDGSNIQVFTHRVERREGAED